MKNKKVTVSLEVLFNRLMSYGTEEDYVSADYGYIRRETEDDKTWFDFEKNILPYEGRACMDGEVCDVIEETNDFVVLQETNEHIPFKLSREEFNVAAVLCS